MTADSGDKPGRRAGAAHVPVLPREVSRFLDVRPGNVVVDGTVGAAGHSRPILEQVGPEGMLIGLDRDPMMLDWAAQVLTAPNCHLRHASYVELPELLAELELERVDRVLLDLGLSSDQLADESRGFSFQATGPLDLRFDTSRGTPAWQFLQQASEEELADVLHEYGEEPASRRIAAWLVAHRATAPVRTAAELSQAVSTALGGRAGRRGDKHPATRVFQALRIAVNRELEHVERALREVMPSCLKAGGILVVISFHSLEDRLVKQTFRDEEIWLNLTSKPVTATPAEQRMNPRSRTAKLRAGQRR